ncbi:hypothetical protein C8R46DRAFT_1031476 [Mycena filopes]|nr:hypothetical protein C8R46DRAFT_1031476 [Mycena filopes]
MASSAVETPRSNRGEKATSSGHLDPSSFLWTWGRTPARLRQSSVRRAVLAAPSRITDFRCGYSLHPNTTFNDWNLWTPRKIRRNARTPLDHAIAPNNRTHYHLSPLSLHAARSKSTLARVCVSPASPGFLLTNRTRCASTIAIKHWVAAAKNHFTALPTRRLLVRLEDSGYWNATSFFSTHLASRPKLPSSPRVVEWFNLSLTVAVALGGASIAQFLLPALLFPVNYSDSSAARVTFIRATSCSPRSVHKRVQGRDLFQAAVSLTAILWHIFPRFRHSPGHSSHLFPKTSHTYQMLKLMNMNHSPPQSTGRRIGRNRKDWILDKHCVAAAANRSLLVDIGGSESPRSTRGQRMDQRPFLEVIGFKLISHRRILGWPQAFRADAAPFPVNDPQDEDYTAQSHFGFS